MNLTDKKYAGYALVQEMMDTIGVARNFDPTQTKTIAPKIQSVGRLLMTGEGSSRIFPAKNAIRKALQWGMDLQIATDGSRQSAEYDLSKFAVQLAVVKRRELLFDFGAIHRQPQNTRLSPALRRYRVVELNKIQRVL